MKRSEGKAMIQDPCMRSRTLAGLFLLLLFSGFPLAAEVKTWVTHPTGHTRALKAVRHLVRQIDRDIRSRRLTPSGKVFDADEGGDDWQILFRDPQGRVRKVIRRTSSGDSSVLYHLFYNAQSRLRHARIEARAYNGTHIRHTLSLSEEGETLRETRKQLHGPGWTFPLPWPREDLTLNRP